MYEKKHWDGDLADLTGQCVKVGHELFELFERYRYTGEDQQIHRCTEKKMKIFR